jgi:thiamine-monophosphate kinase
MSRAYKTLAGRKRNVYALSGGEDYELLFAIRPRDKAPLENISGRLGVSITRIGKCLPAKMGIRVVDGSGKTASFSGTGYDHFKTARR